MPARNIDSYLQDARNNFDAVRPTPNCNDANQSIGYCPDIHISTNHYYGFHHLKTPVSNHTAEDCEMLDLEVVSADGAPPSKSTSKKRSADEDDSPQRKRVREEVQREKTIEPETNETKKKSDTNTEEVIEDLYWNIHGGNIFHLIQCL